MCSAELGPKLGHRKFSIKISFSLNEAIGFNGEEKRKKEKRKERKKFCPGKSKMLGSLEDVPPGSPAGKDHPPLRML